MLHFQVTAYYNQGTLFQLISINPYESMLILPQESEVEARQSQDIPEPPCEDQVKTYCTEGTPFLSSANSMNDLREKPENHGASESGSHSTGRSEVKSGVKVIGHENHGASESGSHSTGRSEVTVKSGQGHVLCTGQGSKLLGFRMSGTPKNGDGNPNFLAGFPTGNPGIVR